jgi:hypothetical protein
LPEFALIVFSTTAFSMFAIERLEADREWLGLYQSVWSSMTALSAWCSLWGQKFALEDVIRICA